MKSMLFLVLSSFFLPLSVNAYAETYNVNNYERSNSKARITKIEHLEKGTKISFQYSGSGRVCVHPPGHKDAFYATDITKERKWLLIDTLDSTLCPARKKGKQKFSILMERIDTPHFHVIEGQGETKKGYWYFSNIALNPNQNNIYGNPKDKESVSEKREAGAGSKGNSTEMYGALISKARNIDGIVWQDEPFNAKIVRKPLHEAKEYCNNLSLSGIKGWRLPSKDDFKSLGENFKQLFYTAYHSLYSTRYYSSDGFEAALSGLSGNKPHVVESYDAKGNLARCVISIEEYNRNQKTLEKQSSKRETIDGYLDAFLRSGKKFYFEKASDLSKDDRDREKLENALVTYLGGSKVFQVDVSFNENKILQDNDSLDLGIGKIQSLIGGVLTREDLKMDISVSPKSTTDLDLKYNDYYLIFSVEVEVITDTVAMGIGVTNREISRKSFPIRLNKEEGYKTQETLDLGNFALGGKTHAVWMEMSTKLKAINLKTTIEGVAPAVSI